MKLKQKRKSRNHVPHSKWGEVRKFDYEKYLQNLSDSVNEACNRFFRKRGKVVSYQMKNSQMFNEAHKTA